MLEDKMLNDVEFDAYDRLLDLLISHGLSEERTEEILALVIEEKDISEIYCLLPDIPKTNIQELSREVVTLFKKMDKLRDELADEYIEAKENVVNNGKVFKA